MRGLTNDPACAPQIGLVNTPRVPVQLGPDDVFEGWGILIFVAPGTPPIWGQFEPAVEFTSRLWSPLNIQIALLPYLRFRVKFFPAQPPMFFHWYGFAGVCACCQEVFCFSIIR
jgi:hypothetical protein